MRAMVYLGVEVADADLPLDELVSQCGYDVEHPQLQDAGPPVLADWQGEPCVALPLELRVALMPCELEAWLAAARIFLSHPSLVGFRVLAIEACA